MKTEDYYVVSVAGSLGATTAGEFDEQRVLKMISKAFFFLFNDWFGSLLSMG
ncbi:MAG: hypothetical protein IMF03_10820 [Proteobacteria bacterium]|nr:hypothetical protein [Pseudomonadota bacterium]